jgi:hypothetical protein
MPESYDIPPKDVTDSMSPEEAKMALNAFDADIDRDKMEHAFLKGNHPQHKDAAEYHRRLLEQANTDDRTPEEKVHEDMYQRTVEKETADSEKLKQQAAVELAMLKKLNFDTETNMPDEIMPFHVTAWQRQRLLAEGNFTALGESLKDSLDPTARDIFYGLLNNSHINPESKTKHLQLIIEDIFEADKANFESSRKLSLAELKTQMKAESNKQDEEDSVLVDGKTLAQITEEINRIESIPGLFDLSQKGLKFRQREEFDRLVEERDRLYRARASAKAITDDNNASYQDMIKRASDYKPAKRGR